MIYHKVCLGHEVPKDHLEKPERLKVAISVIHELYAIYPDTLDIFTNPPEGIVLSIRTILREFANANIISFAKNISKISPWKYNER